MTSTLVQTACANGVATIRLEDPRRRNALSLAMFAALEESWATLPDHGAVVIAGSGPSFCAGFDLPAAIDDAMVMPRLIERLSTLLRVIRRHDRPVIAAAHGASIAGGCAILSACDFVVASPASRMGYPVHSIGVSPAVSLPTLRMSTGDGHAREIMMGGKVQSGAQAYRRGLVTHLVPDGTVETVATDLAQSLAAKPRHAVSMTKRWLNELEHTDANEPFDATMQATAGAAATDAAIAALKATWSSRR